MANVSGYTKAGADAAIAAAVASAGLTTEQVQDAVAAMMVAGTNVTSWVYNDTAGTLTLNVAAGSGTDVEVVRDTIGSALVAGTNISVTVNDAGDTITISTTATANATDAALRDRSTHTGTQAATTITGLATVATSGAYTDLTGKPSIPAAPSAATTTAQGIVELATGAETITGTDTVRAVTPAGAKAAISAAISTASRTSVGNRGKIVWIVDDANLTHRDIAAPKIEAVGGKLNLAIFWNALGLNAQTMVAADVTTLYNAGHQVLNHSQTHPNMTTQTAAQRMAEWDKTNLESITAVGAITDFVYPNNASSLATTIEAYGRYLRTFNGPGTGLVRPGDNGLTIGRATWGSGTHQQVLDTMRRIAVTGETFVLYCHAVDVAAVSAINPTMLDEAIALATSLGLQWARADEALTPQPSPFLDYGFETGDLTGAYHALTSKGAGCTIDIVTDTPADGLPGTKSLRMVNDGSGTLNRVSPVGVFRPPVPGEEYTLSGRIRQDKTSGVGGGYFIIRQWDEYGTNLGDTTSTAITATGITPWTQVSVAFTVNKLTRGFQVWCAQSTMIGTTWFDHLHFGPTRLGVLG